MRERVERTIKENSLFLAGQKVLVAVSGGPDSLCLLHILHSLAESLEISLHVVHIDHGLRPEASAEAVSVKKEAIRLGLPIAVRRVKVRKLQAQFGCSLQEAARKARYSILLDIARLSGAVRIATAHHRDDRVETLLMRLLSGSGIDGLKGTPLKRSLEHGIEVVRPLYYLSRQEIENYCRTFKLSPLLDQSNTRPEYYRNRVRLHLLPYLEAEFGTHVRSALANTAENLTEDAALLNTLGREAFCAVTESCSTDGICLDTNKLNKLPPALQTRVILHALWHAGSVRLGRRHVAQVLALAAHLSPSAQAVMPNGVLAARAYHRMWLSNSVPPRDAAIKVTEIHGPGVTYLSCCGLWLQVEVKSAGVLDLSQLSKNEACLDLEKISWPLLVRGREAGDRMQPLGAPGSRKVKKILADRKIPLRQREQIPLIISGSQLVWLGGVEIADFCKVTTQTEKVLYLKIDNELRGG
ncbi:MAG: tRNA(Ile)-lysidine synthase [Syntrophomonadaceae bacterium]|nr:tRNA(Ile)-lysidine synthase [Bacillota bacterium]